MRVAERDAVRLDDRVDRVVAEADEVIDGADVMPRRAHRAAPVDGLRRQDVHRERRQHPPDGRLDLQRRDSQGERRRVVHQVRRHPFVELRLRLRLRVVHRREHALVGLEAERVRTCAPLRTLKSYLDRT
jgi:hypothetical protein